MVAFLVLTLIAALIPTYFLIVDHPETTGPAILISGFNLPGPKGRASSPTPLTLRFDYSYMRDGPKIHITGGNGATVKLYLSQVIACRSAQSAAVAPLAAASPAPQLLTDAGAHLGEFMFALTYLDPGRNIRLIRVKDASHPSGRIELADLDARGNVTRLTYLSAMTLEAGQLPIDCSLQPSASPDRSSFESRVLNFVQAWPKGTDLDDPAAENNPAVYHLADLGVENVRMDDVFSTVSIAKASPTQAAVQLRGQGIIGGGVQKDYVGPVAVTRWEWVERKMNHWHELAMMIAAGIFAIALTCLLEAGRPLMEASR